jgi:hypothetical protein
VFKIIRVGPSMLVEHVNLRSRRNSLDYSTNDIRWHPTEQLIATGATNSMVMVWNVSNMAMLSSSMFRGHQNTVNKVCWHPIDRQRLFSASRDGTVIEWSIERPDPAKRFQLDNSMAVQDISFQTTFNPLLAAGYEGGQVYVWGNDERRPTHHIPAHERDVVNVEWHPRDNSVLATCSSDRRISIWDLRFTKDPRMTILTPTGVARAIWRPNFDQQLLSSPFMLDFEIKLWDITQPHVPLAIWRGHRKEPSTVIPIVWRDASSFLSCSSGGILRLDTVSEAIIPARSLSTVSVTWNVFDDLAYEYSPIDRRGQLVNPVGAPVLAPLVSSISLKRTDRVPGSNIVRMAHVALEPEDDGRGSVQQLLHFARHYRTQGGSVAELCAHNASVARDAHAADAERVWTILGCIFARAPAPASPQQPLPQAQSAAPQMSPLPPLAQPSLLQQLQQGALTLTGDRSQRLHINVDVSPTRFSDQPTPSVAPSSVRAAAAAASSASASASASAAAAGPIAIPAPSPLAPVREESVFSFATAATASLVHAGVAEPLRFAVSSPDSTALTPPLTPPPAASPTRPDSPVGSFFGEDAAVDDETGTYLLRSPLVAEADAPVLRAQGDAASPRAAAAAVAAATAASNASAAKGVGVPRVAACLPPAQPAVSNDVLFPSVVESLAFRAEVARDVLSAYAELGDVQLCAVLVAVLRAEYRLDELQLDLTLVRQWFFFYLELLQRCGAFTLAVELVRMADYCGLEDIGSFNRGSTSVLQLCAHCNKAIEGLTAVCRNCHRVSADCSLCRRPVLGLFVWCQVCGHGGHEQHMRQWFDKHRLCPAGCMHECAL